jgi:hypothetical protein
VSQEHLDDVTISVTFFCKVPLHKGLKEDTVPLNRGKKVRSIKNMENGEGQ